MMNKLLLLAVFSMSAWAGPATAQYQPNHQNQPIPQAATRPGPIGPTPISALLATIKDLIYIFKLSCPGHSSLENGAIMLQGCSNELGEIDGQLAVMGQSLQNVSLAIHSQALGVYSFQSPSLKLFTSTTRQNVTAGKLDISGTTYKLSLADLALHYETKENVLYVTGQMSWNGNKTSIISPLKVVAGKIATGKILIRGDKTYHIFMDDGDYKLMAE